MAYVLAYAVDSRPRRAGVAIAPVVARRRSFYSSHEAAMLLVEIALSMGIALTSVGLASGC
jgi:hypothetical protein